MAFRPEKGEGFPCDYGSFRNGAQPIPPAEVPASWDEEYGVIVVGSVAMWASLASKSLRTGESLCADKKQKELTNMKKLISILCAVVMVFSLMSVTAFADDDNWAFGALPLNNGNVGTIFYAKDYFAQEGIINPLTVAPYTEEELAVIESNAVVGAQGYLAKELVEKSRAEAGNVSYSLNELVGDPTTRAFIEIWKDQAAIDVHNATEHFTDILPKLAALCESAQPVNLFTEVEF